MASGHNTRIWGLVAVTAVIGIFVAVILVDRLPASAGVEDRLADLDERLARLEHRATRPAEPAGDRAPRLEPAPRARAAEAVPEPERSEVPVVDDPEPLDPPSDEEARALFVLLDDYLAQRASPEDHERLFETLRDGRTVPALLAHLEAAVEADPADLDRRMLLAHAYLAKLFTVPAGPEMGVWGRKAEAQWTAVLERDDHHWEARFRRATGYAYYPDVANKTGDAIREFETLRRQQESGPPETRQAGVYTMLAALYRRQGDVERAEAVLEAGRLRHPDVTSLRESREGGGR